MKTLEKQFSKNGIEYEMLDRGHYCALFKLTLDGVHVGYEVPRIYQNEEYQMAGVTIGARESISGNEQFGNDGSKAFFPNESDRAKSYFKELESTIEAKEAEKTEI